MTFDKIIEEIKNDPRNEEYTKRAIDPIFQVDKDAKVLLIGQAPGRVVEETGISFNDKSGDKLRNWMGIDRDIFLFKRDCNSTYGFLLSRQGQAGGLAT